MGGQQFGSPPRVRGARFTTCGPTDYLRSHAIALVSLTQTA